MWKPRSKLVDSDGNVKHAASLLQLRHIGAKRWNRRFVFLDNHLFCYGKDKGRKDKQVPFELIKTVRRETADKLQREHAPREFASFGWCLAVKGRTLLFCAESEGSVAQWVDYLTALLCAMKGNPTAASIASAAAWAASARGDTGGETHTPTRAATLAEFGAQYDAEHPHEETHYGTLTTLTSPGELLTEETSMLALSEQTRPTPQPSTTVTTEAGQRAALPPPNTQAELLEGAAVAAQAGKRDSGGSGSPSKNSDRTSAAVAGRSSAQGGEESPDSALHSGEEKQEGEEQEDSDSISDGNDRRAYRDVSLLDVSSDDTEGEDRRDDDEEEEGEEDGARAQTSTPHSSGSFAIVDVDAPPSQQERGLAERPLPREVSYARFLLPLAAEPHSHIGYRIPALEGYFKSGDDGSGVTFSRTMEKVGKRDNAQTREVVLTTRHLYLFTKGRLASSQKVRCIDTHDITGVVESTTDKTLMAVLVPTFHDILLKVVPQNSCVPGTPAEVKQQFIAHLYKAHCDVHTDHRFRFHESPAVAKEIRRTEEAKYPPLVVHAGDQMRVGEKTTLLETFAVNADEAVYWSSMVRQVQADCKPRLCALVVTEGSVYSLSDTLQEVMRRTPMRDLLRVEYDRDAQSILLQCRGVDVLFNMQSSVEFDNFLRVLPTAVADGFGRTLRLTPSKQLYSHAKLFSFSTLSGAGGLAGGGATRSAARRRRRFPWAKGKKAVGGTKLLSSFAAAAADEEADNNSATATAAFHHHLQSDFRNSQAIRLFCAQFRFVEEVLQDYDDAVALWKQYEASAGLPCWDTLRLRTTFSTRMRVGEICLSAACRLLDAKECATLAKPSALDMHASVVKEMGTPRAVCVTSEGFLLLRNGIASATAAAASSSATAAGGPPSGGGIEASTTVRGKARSRLSVAVNHISSGGASGGAGKDDDLIMEMVGWSSVAAVVRCHSTEGSSVALLTNRTHPVDYLFHLENAQTMLDVMTAAMGCYARYRHGNTDHMQFLPLYAAPRAQNLAMALKRTVFDPFPTVALRYTPYSFPSDRLRMAFIPDVADACRRFGDNTMYFSGVAWRVRSATLRKCGGRLGEDPGAEMRRQNNHLYKSYIFVLTNVAIYHCTKGGFEVVRRTLLTDITGIAVGLHDPDTLLLSVPSEYDMYFRVEGRGAEVVARLQEAYVEWTNYGHYLPYERQGSHTLDDYGLPVRQVPCVAALGTLTKPAYFNDLQSSRPAAECRHQTQQWHLRCLQRAIASFERAQAAARKDRRPIPSSAASVNGGGNMLQRSTWGRMRAALAERQSFLYFVQRRCFRFGLTSEDFEEMQRAQRLLRNYREMEASATALMEATSSTDPAVFRAALQRASAVPDLRLLVEEETRVYEGYLARRACLTSIFSAVQRYRYRPHGANGTSFVELEAALLDLLHEARRVGFDDAFLGYTVRVVRVLVQRMQIQRLICDPANQQRLSMMSVGEWVLLQQAAGEVGMEWRPAVKAMVVRSPAVRLRLNVRVAQLALSRSVVTGETALIRGAVTFALSVLDACDSDNTAAPQATGSAEDAKGREAAVSALHRAVATVQDAFTPSKVEEQQHLARAVEALIAARQTHQRQQTWTPSIVAAMLATCVELEEQVVAQPHPFLHHGTQSVLAMEHAMLTEQQHRLQLRHTMIKKELKAQQQHERELQKRRLAAQRAATRRQRCEAALQERRQRRALELWGSQVDQLVSKLDAVLANADTEADAFIRLGIKRCVHLQRWIIEAAARYGLSAPSSFASPTQGSQHRTASPAAAAGKAEATLAELVSRLQTVAARAQRLLDKRARGGADPYGRTNGSDGSYMPVTSRFTEASAGAAGTRAASEDGDVDAAPLALPAEVGVLIATLDAGGLVAYIQEHHDSAAMPRLVDQIRVQWQRARRHQRWVAALHRRLHAAAVLHSRELLEASLRQAEEVNFTDAAVEAARRAVAAMTTRRSIAQRCPQQTNADDASASTTTSSPASIVVDPWRRVLVAPADTEETDKKEVLAQSAATVSAAPLTAGEEEVPAEAAVAGATDRAPVKKPRVEKVLKEMEGVACVAETIPAAMPSAKAVLQRLYAATVALVNSAVATAETQHSAALSASDDDDVSGATDTEQAMSIAADNTFCAPFLQAWRAVLEHQLRPSGLLIKTPRTVWDLVRDMGNENTDGEYVAPYVTRLSSDFQRLYRSTDDSDAARQRTDAVLLALLFFSHRMACVVDGVMQLGERGRRALLLPDSLLARPEAVRALLAAAHVCDALRWQATSVQALAMACLFPGNTAVEVPVPPRLWSSAPPLPPAPSSHPGDLQRAGSSGGVLAATQPPPPGAAAVQQRRSFPPPTLAQTLSGSFALSSAAVEVPVSATPRTGAGEAPSAAAREKHSAKALRRLQEAVRDVASYFTRQLRAHGPAPAPTQTSASYFDEHIYPEVGAVVEASLLPALVSLLSCGLVRRYQLVRTRTLWDVVKALKKMLATSSRTLAAAEVLPIMDLVEALTDTTDAHGRNGTKLQTLSDEQLDDLRVRVFLRECLNRRQLYPLVCALFPPSNGYEAWTGGGGTGVLWTLYNPVLCLLYPPDAAPSVELRPLLERLSALPFVLIPDRELR
jgi:hypothetical protein